MLLSFAGCDMPDDSGTMSSANHSSSGGGGCSPEVLRKSFGSVNSVNGKTYYWQPKHTRMACDAIAHHRNLVDGIKGKGNPLRGVCNNYEELSTTKKFDTLAIAVAAVGNGESGFNPTDNWKNSGKEKRKYVRARAFLQISQNAEDWGCFRDGKGPEDAKASIECAYKMFDGQYQKRGSSIANNSSHFSVLRPNNKLSKFMNSFRLHAPWCSASFGVKKTNMKPMFEVPTYVESSDLNRNSHAL